ncbi:MAG: hypothetical protein R3E53_23125 [Myxococcota bacterium]
MRNRIAQLGKLTDMLEDADWRLEGEDRKRVLNALAYFADPDDLIPDRCPDSATSTTRSWSSSSSPT